MTFHLSHKCQHCDAADIFRFFIAGMFQKKMRSEPLWCPIGAVVLVIACPRRRVLPLVRNLLLQPSQERVQGAWASILCHSLVCYHSSLTGLVEISLPMVIYSLVTAPNINLDSYECQDRTHFPNRNPLRRLRVYFDGGYYDVNHFAILHYQCHSVNIILQFIDSRVTILSVMYKANSKSNNNILLMLKSQ